MNKMPKVVHIHKAIFEYANENGEFSLFKFTALLFSQNINLINIIHVVCNALFKQFHQDFFNKILTNSNSKFAS